MKKTILYTLMVVLVSTSCYGYSNHKQVRYEYRCLNGYLTLVKITRFNKVEHVSPIKIVTTDTGRKQKCSKY